MIDVRLSPEILARGIGDGAAATLRRELRDTGFEYASLVVDATMPPNEIHLYAGGDLKVRITNIGGPT